MHRALGICVLSVLVCAAAFASPAAVDQVKARGDQFAAAWNKHDAKAMAAMFAPDGDLLNPVGRYASGRAEVEKLFHDEHSTFMKHSTYKNVRSSVHLLDADAAVGDWDIEISGMTDPNGKAMPVEKTHVTCVMKNAGGNWWIVSARAFDLMTPPPMPKAAAK